ncbi:UNVERIFIED_CONTAM: class I SAM-dependent methyltransferase [Halobacillus marinus]
MFGFYNSLSAEVYDLDKPIGHSFGDIEFYLDHLGGVNGRLLEPAVGTGRLLIPLLENGYDVDGFDLSPDMLAVCRTNCRQSGFAPKLFEADMTDFDLGEEYGAIVVPTGTFLLIHEREKSISALRQFHHHLKTGGKLLLDVFLETDIQLGKVSVKQWDCPNGDTITLEAKQVEVDYIHQYVVSHHRYERWRNGKLMESEQERFPTRWYGVEEFSLVLQACGFEVKEISADYKRGVYPSKSDQVITFEAVKK